MSKEELKKVSDTKTTKLFKKGETIFAENEKLNGVFCVRHGVSKLSKLSPNGKDQIVKLASKGSVLGQRSVIVEEISNLSAVALNDMEACFIPKNAIVNTLNANPNFAVEVLRHMAHDLKEADDVIVNMSQKTVKQRVAEAFIYLKNNFGEDNEAWPINEYRVHWQRPPRFWKPNSVRKRCVHNGAAFPNTCVTCPN